MSYSKKVGKLRLNDDTLKQTNEIKIAAPLLAAIDIDGLVITADALLTQRDFARYLVEERQAHYHFTVKANQKTLFEDLQVYFTRLDAPPDAVDIDLGHGRIETRRIWVSTKLNLYLDFPHVAQAFAIERERIDKKTGKHSCETVYGLTSQSELDARPIDLLRTNRNHWCIENRCHYVLDWNYDEDRCRIRCGHGPENITRLRRFAVGIIHATSSKGVAETMRDLVMNTRMVFDYLKMTRSSMRRGYLL